MKRPIRIAALRVPRITRGRDQSRLGGRVAVRSDPARRSLRAPAARAHCLFLAPSPMTSRRWCAIEVPVSDTPRSSTAVRARCASRSCSTKCRSSDVDLYVDANRNRRIEPGDRLVAEADRTWRTPLSVAVVEGETTQA